MTAPQILLDPVDFDALHLSALAFGGIGGGMETAGGEPVCLIGHARGLEQMGSWDDDKRSAKLLDRANAAGLNWWVQDKALEAARIPNGDRIPFTSYARLLNIDVKAVA